MYLSYNKSCKIVKRVKRWKESGDRPLFDSSVDYLYDYIDWRDLAAQALRAEMVYLWTRMPKRKVFLLHAHGEHLGYDVELISVHHSCSTRTENISVMVPVRQVIDVLSNVLPIGCRIT